MAKTGNTIQIPVKIFDAEANTHVESFYMVDEYDTGAEQNEENTKLIRRLAQKETLGEE
jgi:hypothetical protein